ncbi:hydroxysteroid dehydrogenase-like protein 1 [Trichonephila clavipes]|nr:hydroxysteroid dehydrogenase-like protein 1 [Trichonephila clavipes]
MATLASGYGQTRQGLPQGYVSSPVSFNIMINGCDVPPLKYIPRSISTSHGLLSFIDNAVPEINSLLYADDLVLWSTGSDIPKLESTLNSTLVTLANWSLENERENETLRPTIFPGHLRYASANLDLVLPIHKHNSLLAELRSTIHERYLDQDWLHVLTDGSATAPFGRAGAGVFSNCFNLKEPLSAWSDNFDERSFSNGSHLIAAFMETNSRQAGQRGFDAASTLSSDASSKRQATFQGQIVTEENFHSYRPSCWQTLVLSARSPKTCPAFCPI